MSFLLSPVDGGKSEHVAAWPQKSSLVGTVAAQRNSSIQCLRGLAAISVALYHASIYSERHFGVSAWSSAFDGRFGLSGVAVFFAISGWLMADLIQRTDPWRFLAHRIVRIYPPFLLAVAVSVPVIALLGIRKMGPHIFSLMLVPVGERTYYLGVEWTLVFECTYYVALFLLARAGWHRYLTGLALAWLAVIGVTPLVIDWDDSPLRPISSIWLSGANVAFAGGLLIPWIAANVRIPVGTGIIAICLLMTMPSANLVTARWAAGAAATLLTMDFMRIKLPENTPAVLFRLGDWSYALYLCHLPCILVVYRLWPVSLGIGGAWLFAIAVTLIVSVGFGMFDVRMYRYLKDAVDRLDRRTLHRRVGVFVSAFVLASLIGLVVT
jgi:exopolysaccharide production protein ExoZ